MSIWRKLSVLGLLLTIIQTALALTGRDGAPEDAGEIAMLAALLGNGAAPAPAGQPAEADKLLSILSR